MCDAYLASCFNEHDRAQVQALVDANNETELESCMLPRISFGTSGLRGKMQAGFARINDLTIFQASLGLRDYVLQTVPDAKSRGIVSPRQLISVLLFIVSGHRIRSQAQFTKICTDC